MPISIRTGSESDAEAVANLTLQLGYDVTPADAKERLARILARPDQQLFIADDDGRPVAWLHAIKAEYLEADPFVMIAGLVVDRTCRNRGIGHRLMEKAEQWAKEQQCSLVRLSSSAGRVAAHRFYERLGYTIVKTQYAFAKSFDADAASKVTRLAPRIDAETV